MHNATRQAVYSPCDRVLYSVKSFPRRALGAMPESSPMKAVGVDHFLSGELLTLDRHVGS